MPVENRDLYFFCRIFSSFNPLTMDLADIVQVYDVADQSPCKVTRTSNLDHDYVVQRLNLFALGMPHMVAGLAALEQEREINRRQRAIILSYRTGQWEGHRTTGPFPERRQPTFLYRASIDRYWSRTMCPVCLDSIGQFSTVTYTRGGRWVHMDCWGQPYAKCHTCANVGVGKVQLENAMTCRDCMQPRRQRNYPVI
jgi:hypothetical protein